MHFRMREGSGIAYYYIGVRDNGDLEGINIYEMKYTLYNLIKMASNI